MTTTTGIKLKRIKSPLSDPWRRAVAISSRTVNYVGDRPTLSSRLLGPGVIGKLRDLLRIV